MGNSRERNLKKNVIVMFVIKVCSMGISFLYIPLLFNSLDTEHYAVWLTLTSIVSWITLFDIGLGNGLRNKLAESVAVGDFVRGREYVSTAYGSILIFSVVLISVFFLVYRYVPWNRILNATTISEHYIDTLVAIVFISFVANFCLSLINSVLYALQVPGIVAVINFVGQSMSFLLVLFSVRVLGVSDLLSLGSIISIVPPSVLFIVTIIIFKSKYPQLLPTLSFFKIEKVKDILAIKFFIIQIVTIILFQTNSLIITHTVDNSAVIEYNIAYKYMYILVTMYTILCMPMWSATTDAYTKGDIKWISTVRKKLFYIFLLFVFVGVIMLVLAKYVYKLWIGIECPEIEFSTTALLLLYSTFMMIYAANGYILNGIGKLNIQIVFTSVLALLYIPMASFLGKIYGLSGILIALCFNGFSNSIWSFVQLNKIIKGRAYGIWNK